MKRILSLTLAALMLLCLCACNDQTDAPTTPTGSRPASPLYAIDSYTASNDAVAAAMDNVFGTVGTQELTVRLLQIAYWTEYSTFVRSYGNYVTTLGLDPNAPLDAQPCKSMGGGTWQQYFLKQALATLHEYFAMEQAAKSKGVSLPDDLAADVEDLPNQLKLAAEEEGFASADALVQARFGPGCTAEDYCEYFRLSIYSYYYYSKCLDEMVITDQMVQDYFNENTQALASSGIVKDGVLTYTCRNLLVPLKDGDWDKCQADAQALWDNWLAGEKTEEAFAALATQHSKDQENAHQGGLREGLMAQSNLDEAVVSWYSDPARQSGDCQLIKCKDGYEILYFCGAVEYWFFMCRTAVRNVTSEQIRQDILDAHSLQVDYTRILLSDMELSVDTGDVPTE